MSVKVDDIANAIVAYLPTGQYTDLLATVDNTVKKYTAIRDVKQLAEHKIVVIPMEVERNRTARGDRMTRGGGACLLVEYPQIEILVEMQANENEDAKIRQLLQLGEDIAVNLRAQPQAGYPWKDELLTVLADQELLTNQQIFASSIRVRYGK